MDPSAFFVSIVFSLLLGSLSVAAWNRAPARWRCDSGSVPGKAQKECALGLIPWVLPFSLLFLPLLWPGASSSGIFQCLPAGVLVFALIQLSICDLRFHILQDQWILFLALAGLFYQVPFISRAAGLALPLGLYAASAWAARRGGRSLGLGAGDAKLAAALGFAFGAQDMAAILCRAFLAAGVVALALLLTKKAAKGDRIAFGPFAAFACYCYLLSTRLM